MEQRENAPHGEDLSAMQRRRGGKKEESSIPWWYKRTLEGRVDVKRDRDNQDGIPWWYKKNVERRNYEQKDEAVYPFRTREK